MLAQFVVSLVVIASHRRFLERPVHALHLTVGPRMVRLRSTVIDIVLCAGQFEGVTAKAFA